MATQRQSPSEERDYRATALSNLLQVAHSRLMHQALSHSRGRDDAEDALSDACVQFLRFYDGPAGEAALHWMLLVIKRSAWAIGRGRVGELIEVVVPDDRLGPAELVERAEETEQLIESIELLKPDERVALILLGLGCSYAEIRDLRAGARERFAVALTRAAPASERCWRRG